MPTAFSFLITGTDTGVGKTHVGQVLASALCARGVRAGVFKPLESGWPAGGAGSDADLLSRAAGGVQAIEDVCLYPLQAPVAPLAAAEMEGVEIDVGRIGAHLSDLQARFDAVLIEGAGGLLAPLAPDWNILDLARERGLASIVVVANKLGCLNHALLTDAALAGAGIRRLGFVMNALPGVSDASAGSNAKYLSSLTKLPLFDISRKSDIELLIKEMGFGS